jgi:hypothetical protein
MTSELSGGSPRNNGNKENHANQGSLAVTQSPPRESVLQLRDYNQHWNVPTNFSTYIKYNTSWIFVQLFLTYMWTDREADRQGQVNRCICATFSCERRLKTQGAGNWHLFGTGSYGGRLLARWPLIQSQLSRKKLLLFSKYSVFRLFNYLYQVWMSNYEAFMNGGLRKRCVYQTCRAHTKKGLRSRTTSTVKTQCWLTSRLLRHAFNLLLWHSHSLYPDAIMSVYLSLFLLDCPHLP